MKTRTFLLCISAISFLSFSLRFLIGPNPLFGAAFDDELMIKLASSISNGDWAGSYSEIGHVGLSKPVGYPLFLLAISWLPLAPTDVVHLLLLSGFLLLLREFSFWGLGRKLFILSYGLFSFYPPLFNEPISRIYRDGYLAALTLWILVFALLVNRLLKELKSPFNVKSLLKVSLACLTLGVLGGLFVITKNTWHYVLLLVVGVFLIGFRLEAKTRSTRRHLILKRLGAFLLGFIGVASVVNFVVQNNYDKYGVRTIDTFSYGAFPDAMRSIYSVKQATSRPYVDVDAQTRAEIYRISPTFLLLKPYLELPQSQGWRGTSCASLMKICDESGAWFPWDLRDAVQSAGLGRSAKDFEKSLRTIQVEIDYACEQKKISCERKGIAPGLDSLDSISPRLVINSIFYGVAELVNPRSGQATRPSGINVSPDSGRLWGEIVNRLPNSSFSTDYHNRSFFLTDVRNLMGNIYVAFWIPFVLVGLLGLIIRFDRKDLRSLVGLLIIGACFLLLLQISLLEASSGVYMIPGAELYLICLIPLVFAALTLGLTRLVTIFNFDQVGEIFKK